VGSISRRRALQSIVAVIAAAYGRGCAPQAVPRPLRTPLGERRARTLVVYDDGWLGELHAIGAGVVASRFGAWSAIAASSYRRGAIDAHDAAVYVGASRDRALPAAFLDDVLAGATPVVWLGANVAQLAARTTDFRARHGFLPAAFDDGPYRAVLYKGARLPRRVGDASGVMTYAAIDTSVAQVVASAVRDDGTEVPWALRAGHLTYVGEDPLAWVTPCDRLLALCDLMFDALAPAAPERHRAVVRIEDVSPRSSPGSLRAVADRLSSRGVPFSVALIPVFEDPRGAESEGRPTRVRLRDAPGVVEALRYMLARGGSLVLHGYTHQHGAIANPVNGVTGTDFEFYRAHLEGGRVALDGPVAGDSESWAADRVERALDEIAGAGLPRPEIFEFPHYAGSPADARAIARMIDVAFHRGLFFPGTLSGTNEDTSRSLGLVLPYLVRDVYGFRLVPENLGNYVPAAEDPARAQSADDIVERARSLRVVRDGVAGFFFHPIYDASILERIVDGLAADGWTFAHATDIAREPGV
jgi:uncharacterized protein YdaL